MISATVLAVFLVPVFFVVVLGAAERLRSRFAGRRAAPAALVVTTHKE